jgi:hypothetical protein
VLIANDVHRRVQPTAFLCVSPAPGMVKYLELDRAQDMYGRLAYLHCNHKPAIEVLEILTPTK